MQLFQINLNRNLFVLLTCFLLTACKKNENGTIHPSYVQCINVSPDAPAINFLGNNLLIGENLPYSGISTNATMPPVTSGFDIAEASSHNALIKFYTTLIPGASYSLFAIDSFSKMKASMVNNIFFTPSPDSTLIRFFHFSPDANYIVPYLENPSDTFSLGVRSFNDQQTYSFYSNFVEIPSGTYSLQMNIDSTSYFFPLDLAGGKVYTIFAKGFVHGTGTSALDAGMLEHL